jgi:hypothetical protein
MNEVLWPELALFHAIPNGGFRTKVTAAKLKAEGVKAGVLDTHLPVARGGYHGLWIEMKYGRNKPTEEQKWWIEELRSQGHFVTVCYGWEPAAETLEHYIRGRILAIGAWGE